MHARAGRDSTAGRGSRGDGGGGGRGGANSNARLGGTPAASGVSEGSVKAVTAHLKAMVASRLLRHAAAGPSGLR